MNTLIIAPLLFFFLSFVFSMLGMGGSQVYVPVLFWLGLDFKTEAIPLGMLLSVITSISASFTYWLRNLIDWQIGLFLGITMFISAPFGALLNGILSTRTIIMIFIIFTLFAALLMLSGWRPNSSKLTEKKRLLAGLSGGSILGFSAGLLGRGGGAFIVPLLYITGLEVQAAAATSSFIVVFSGSSSFLSHIFTAAKPQALLWILSSIAVLLGSQAGSKFMSRKLNPKVIKTLFGVSLIIISVVLFIQNFIL